MFTNSHNKHVSGFILTDIGDYLFKQIYLYIKMKKTVKI